MNRACRRSVLAIAVAGLALVPAAQGALVVNSGVAGVKLQMTPAKVRAVLGKPAATRTVRHPITGSVTIHTYRGLVIHYFHGRVGHIVTTRTAERTKKGIGVGSTEVQVRTRVGRVTCSTAAGRRSCSVGNFRPGTPVTSFDLRNDRVYRVSVGLVID